MSSSSSRGGWYAVARVSECKEHMKRLGWVFVNRAGKTYRFDRKIKPSSKGKVTSVALTLGQLRQVIDNDIDVAKAAAAVERT